MSSLPPELVEPLEQLPAKLVEINTSEQACMIDIVTSASRGKSIPEAQAVMARCRQTSAAAGGLKRSVHQLLLLVSFQALLPEF
jgi:hypothetical protein